jgi:hypothetical protein
MMFPHLVVPLVCLTVSVAAQEDDGAFKAENLKITMTLEKRGVDGDLLTPAGSTITETSALKPCALIVSKPEVALIMLIFTKMAVDPVYVYTAHVTKLLVK